MPLYKTLEQIFEEVKSVALENNLSVDDIVENTQADPNLVRALFDDTTDVVGSISRIIDFTKIKLHSKILTFKTYHLTEDSTQIKVTRVVEPKCSMIYDKGTDKFYKFQYKKRLKQQSKETTNIIKFEISEFVYSYLTNKNTL